MVHPLGSAPLGEPHGEHGGADFTSSKHSWDVCRTSHRPQQTPVKTGCPRDPTVSPRQGGSQPMPLAPSVSGEGEEAVVGDRALHGRAHCCPQAGGLCFLPSSAWNTGCATPSHGPVNRVHSEVRAPGTPHRHPPTVVSPEAHPLP